jgi:hypothetical protein
MPSITAGTKKEQQIRVKAEFEVERRKIMVEREHDKGRRVFGLFRLGWLPSIHRDTLYI